MTAAAALPPMADPAAREPLSIHDSYAWCEAQVQAAQSNFYRAFKLLPRDRRKAIYANYAFMRFLDDLSDEAQTGAAERLADLKAILPGLCVADPNPAGVARHPSLPALMHAAVRYQVDPAVYGHLIDGVASDLTVTRYPTFEAMKQYCYQVAGVVGLTCVSIWSDQKDGIAEKAVAGGYAVQITNIIRDVAEDAERGRIYLPLEDLERFKVSEAQVLAHQDSDDFRKLLQFQAARARAFFAQAFQVKDQIRPDCRQAWWLTLGAYQKLLDRIEKNGFDVMGGRTRLTFWDKLGLFFAAKGIR